MLRKLVSTSALTFLCVAVLSFSASSVSADSPKPTGLTISPVNYVGNFRPGEVLDTGFNLKNNTDSTITLTLKAADVGNSKVSEDPASAAGWIALNQAQITLAPAQATDIKVTVTMPKTATAGAYYPTVLIKLNAENPAHTGTAIDAELSYPMAINIVGELPKTSVQVTRLTADGPVFTGKTTINYEITNPLTLFIRPIAYLQVLNPQGLPVYRETINESLATLSAGQKLTGTVSVDLPSDISSIGNFHVELLVLDQQFSTSDILKTDFLVIPIWLPVGVGVAVVMAGLAGKTFLARRKRKK